MRECPWCKGTDIRYSIRTSTSNFKRIYHASFYCWDCNCYGPRIIYKPDDTMHRVDVERNLELKQQALNAWENR